MNRTELNKIINTIVVAPCQHSVLIDNIQLSDNILDVELIHSDESGTIETETLEITSNGTIFRNGSSFITPADLLELPQPVRKYCLMFVVALRWKFRASSELDSSARIKILPRQRGSVCASRTLVCCWHSR